MAPRVSPTERILADRSTTCSRGTLTSLMWLSRSHACPSGSTSRASWRSSSAFSSTETATAPRRRQPRGIPKRLQPPRTIKTTFGPVELQRPKLRGAQSALCEHLFGQGVSRTNTLETLVISCWVRGRFDRDIEAMLIETFGRDASISKWTASRICQRLRAEFDAWRRQDLSKLKIDYLYADGSYFKMHPKAKAEPVVAWGVDTDGKPHFLGLAWVLRSPPTPGRASSRT